jgi:hypothetical protein
MAKIATSVDRRDRVSHEPGDGNAEHRQGPRRVGDAKARIVSHQELGDGGYRALLARALALASAEVSWLGAVRVKTDGSFEKFSQAVNELQEKMGISSKTEYERLRRASEEWRVHSEQARLALEQHVAAHNC